MPPEDNPYMNLTSSAPAREQVPVGENNPYMGLQPQQAAPTTMASPFPTVPTPEQNPYAEIPSVSERLWGGYPAARDEEPSSRSDFFDPILRGLVGFTQQFARGPSELVTQTKSSLVGGNAKNSGSAMKGFGVLFDNATVANMGQGLKDWGTAAEKGIGLPQVPSFTNIRTDTLPNFVSDTAAYTGGALGQAIGSSAVSLAGGTAGGILTGGNPIGFMAGAALPGYVQNFGELYDAIENDKDIQARVTSGATTPRELAGAAALAAVPMAALDAFGMERVLGKALFTEAKTALQARLGRAIALGSLTEGGTEALQEIISQWTQDYLGSKSPMSQKIISVVDNAIGGALGGGLFGGAGAVMQRDSTPVTQDQINAVFGSSKAGKPTVGPKGETGTLTQPPQTTPSPGIEAFGPEPPPVDSLDAYGGETVPPTDKLAAPVDLGFGLKITSVEEEPYRYSLLDEEDKVLDGDNDFGALRARANNYLETGEFITPTVTPAKPLSDDEALNFSGAKKGGSATATPPSEPEKPAGPAEVKVLRQPDRQWVTQGGELLNLSEVAEMAVDFLAKNPANKEFLDAFIEGKPKGFLKRLKGEPAPALQDVIDRAIATGLNIKRLTRSSAAGDLPTGPRPPGVLPSNVVAFIEKKKPRLGIPTEPTSPTPPSTPSPLSPQREGTSAEGTMAAVPRSNTRRVIEILGPGLYGDYANIPEVTIKEGFQNAFDGIKELIESGELEKGRIDIITDYVAGTITIVDNGVGMSRETLAGPFLEVAGTKKGTKRSSGGFGIAKLLYLYTNEEISVVSLNNGVVSRLSSTGDQLMQALEGEGTPPQVTWGPPGQAERDLFPDGHGTAIRIKIPKEFEDPGTGEKKTVHFPYNPEGVDALRWSPLFYNVDVTFNGKPLMHVGSSFIKEDFDTFGTIKFGWGKGHLYVSKGPKQGNSWDSNFHVLSNGIYQFSLGLALDPAQPYGEKVNHTFFLDLEPESKPGTPGYPVAPNRQDFSAATKKGFSQLLIYLSNTYNFENMKNDADNFGEMYYLSEGGKNKSKPITIKPKKPDQLPVKTLKPGDKITVEEGRLVVNGKPAEEIDLNKLRDKAPKVESLIVEQSEIDPDRVMVHDNTIVEISELEHKSITQLGQEKFGRRFDEFLFEIGDAFRDLRDVVADAMQREQYETKPLYPTEYAALKEDAVGISFDIEYRGVSIRVPFSGGFINPALPEYKDTIRAGVGVVGTMVHELAHFRVRSHNADFPAEMQRIIIALDTHGSFDFHAFKQRVVASYGRNKDIFDYINGLYTGVHRVRARGKRFSDTGTIEGRNAGASGAMAQARSSERGISTLFGRPQEGERVATPRQDQRGTGFRVAEGGTLDLQAANDRNIRIAREIDPGIDLGYPQAEVEKIYDKLYDGFKTEAARRGTRATSGGGTGATIPPTGGVPPPATPAPPGGVPPGLPSMTAHASRISKYYKYFFGLDRLVDRFPAFAPLRRYAERVREMRLDASKIHEYAIRITRKWRALGEVRGEKLAELIDEVTNMTYRTPAEIARGVARNPTPTEFNGLVTRIGVDAETLAVFNEQKDFFARFLIAISNLAMQTARRTISDPIKLADRLDAIRDQVRQLSSRPYFPFTRFGMYFITVRNAAGDVTLFQTYERKGLKSAERVRDEAYNRIKASLPPGHTIIRDTLPESAAPFVGLPPELLEAISRELTLSPDQQQALEQLRYKYAPSSSFVHHLQNKNYVPGYSHDFLRAFSRYAFHGARYYSRVKYGHLLRGEIAAARAVGTDRASSIADYMQDHLNATVLDTKGDFGIFKGAIFLWVFGYSVAGAAINLSQIPVITFPFLAAKFGGIGKGDALASAALVNAMRKLNNYYKRGEYAGHTEFEMRAFDYAVRSSRISESMASELAGLAQGEGLLGLGHKSKVGRGFQVFLEKAPLFFELSEQFNRRVTYRAALDLGMAHPNAVGIQEALNKHQDEYQQLLTDPRYNFTPEQAKAVIGAIYAVEQTQFVYARETRPAFMRGRLAGSVFVFKTYLVNVLQLMGANKSSVMPRYILIMLGLAGLMGVPGAEDLEDILNQFGKWWFGKDFKLQLAIREFVNDISGGKIPPDLILHGMSRRGFGIPALLDMMGENPGRGLHAGPGQNVPAPVFDMSKSLGMGRIIPADLGKILDPGKNVEKTIASTAQQASGAIFSVGFNLFKALSASDTDWTDAKRWERAMPRALASASRAFRVGAEGRERGAGRPNSAATIVPYNIYDTEQAAEIIGMGLGFMPLRQAAKWDAIIAQQEVDQKFTFEREILMAQMFEAVKSKDPNAVAKIRDNIKEYNKELPKWLRGKQITGEQLNNSLKQRELTKQYREAGVPRQRGSQPIAKHIQELFPESVVDVRKVPR